MATAAGERLADDLVLEILAHAYTDVVTLFRCAATCKRWRALVADLSFLRRRCPERERHPSSLLGFFVQQQRCGDENNNGLLQPVFLPPLSGSAFGSRRRSLASFIPGLPLDELDGAVPLAARHGLLLVRLARQASDDSARLAVCNLLAGTCDVLPSLKRGVFSVNCAIVTDADCSNGHLQRSPLSPSYHSDFFKVLAIVADDSRNDHQECNNLYTFSSVALGWSEPKNCLEAVKQSGEHDLPVLQWRNKVVVCGGVAHWLMSSMSKQYILFVSIDTGDITLKELSLPKELLHDARRYIGGPTLCVTAAGLPSLFWLQEEGPLLDMWMPADDGAYWPYARTVELKPPKMWNPSIVHVWSGEKSGVLLVIDTFRCVHMVDLESGVVEDVSEQFLSSWGMMAIPMEIDWPALFMSRLGGG